MISRHQHDLITDHDVTLETAYQGHSLQEELTATRGMLKRGEGAAKRAERELRDRVAELESAAAEAATAAAAATTDAAGAEGFSILTPEPSNPAQARRYDSMRDELASTRSELSSLKIRYGMLEKDFDSVSQKLSRAQQAHHVASESLLGSLSIGIAPSPRQGSSSTSGFAMKGSAKESSVKLAANPFAKLMGSRSALMMMYIFVVHVILMALLARKPTVCLPGDEGGSRLP